MDLRIPSIEVPGSVQNSLTGAYLRGFLSRKPGHLEPGSGGVELCADQEEVQVPGGKLLSQYAALCGFAPGRGVPPTWPHIMATRMQLGLVTAPQFPVRLAGLIHLKHELHQLRPLAVNETVGVQARILPHEDTTRGNEFRLVTDIHAREGLVWSETLTFLARGLRSRPPRGSRNGDDSPRWTDAFEFAAPASIGRRYARVSGDFNPIHLSSVTARWFGFSRPIAHGMWTLARCVGALMGNRDSLSLQAEFRSPAFLPTTLQLLSREEGDHSDFELRNSETERACLVGALSSKVEFAD